MSTASTALGVAESRRPGPSGRLQVSITAPSETVTLCAVAGEIDFHTAESLRSHLLGALNTGSPTVVVDLSRVLFFGVAGLSVLIEVRTRAERSGLRVRLVTGPRCVARVLEVAGDAALFEQTTDLATAVLDVV